MSLTSETRNGRPLLLLVGLVAGVAAGCSVVAALVVMAVGEDAPPPAGAASTPTTEPATPTPDTGVPVQLATPDSSIAGVGRGWPPGEAGAVSAAADYTTASTVDLDVLRARLRTMYAAGNGADAEIVRIMRDTRRGRANLGIPPGRGPGLAQVDLTPLAVRHEVEQAGEVAGYVLVRRQLTSYDGDRLPADLFPVPFVVRWVNDDWKLTADGVTWSPPAVPSRVGSDAEGGWHALLPAR